MDARKITRRIFQRHARYFDPAKVKEDQVERLVARLIARSSLDPPAARAGPADAPFAEDLNRVSEAELVRAKRLMDEDFTKTLKRPGDEGYVYDKEVDFDEPGDSDGSWDD